MLQKLYRTDYTGEFLIYNVELEDGQYEEEREWLPNSVENANHYKHAVIIGNGLSRKNFNLTKIKNHRTGIGGVNRIQSYGCNALHRDFSPDFLIATNKGIISEINDKPLPESTLVLTTPMNILENPGKYHLIPYGVYLNAGSVATYMACFDGHKKVYLLGFDNQSNLVNNNVYAGTTNYDNVETKVVSTKWEISMANIFRTYNDVEFIRIDAQGETPKSWRSCLNYRQINARQFALEVDL